MNNKKSLLFKTTALTTVFTLNVSLYATLHKNAQKVDAYSAVSTLPSTIDLNDCTEQEIRSYYSNLNSLSTSERKGTNLLKNLKPILSNNQNYFSYDSGNTIWQLYEIADRDWVKSPASDITYGTYNANTNIITNYQYGTGNNDGKNNPYLHALYIDRDIDHQVKAWGNHNQDMWGINREHIWAKSHGFQADGNGGARGDPMHLWAANGYANNIHSNYFYGFVDKTSDYVDCGTTYSSVPNNLRGFSKTLGGGTVFEPQDCDKGDIARAIFYMVARYNNYANESSGFGTDNPNLVLLNDLSENGTTGTSSASNPYGMGILSDLLAWNKLDPVDEYEIHRNNLLYKNYTNNRNPFIDFPSWADAIWGTADLDGTNYNSTITTSASPSTDTINAINTTKPFAISEDSIDLVVGDTATIYASNAESNISWSVSNGSVACINKNSTSNNETVTITALSAGTTTITATSGTDSASCTITVSEATNYGTLSRPLSVNEAIQVINITGTSETPEPLYVKGIVSSNTEYNTTYKNYDEIWLEDDDGVVHSFELYRAKFDTSITNNYTTENSMVGKEVIVYGLGKVYNGQPELTYSSSGTPKYPTIMSITDPSPTGIELDIDNTTIDIDETVTLTATLIPNNTFATVVWESSDETVATVSNGVVTGVSGGQVTITARVENTNIEAQCVITVNAPQLGPKDYLTNDMSVATLDGNPTTAYQPSTDSITFNQAGLSNGEDITDIPIGSVILNGYAGTNTGGNNPKYYSTGNAMRIYAGNTITFTAGSAIISIVLNVSSGSASDLSENTGSYNAGTWTGSSNTVTFTHTGTSQIRITSISVTYSKQSIAFDSIAMIMGAKIPVSTWVTINESWEITDYGVMLFRCEPENIDSVNTVEEYYTASASNVSIIRTNSGNPPTAVDGYYDFSVQINIKKTTNYDRYYVAAPFIVANGNFYFLAEMRYSINTLASYYLTHGGSALSTEALQYLATTH